MKFIRTVEYSSPAGRIILGFYEDRLCICDWKSGKKLDHICKTVCRNLDGVILEDNCKSAPLVISQLDEYFEGKRAEFSVPFLITGTEFQRIVRHELLNIPFGATVSYQDISRKIGNPNAVRAVAQAIASNPISIIVPCHRVIGSDGNLTGYAGGLYVKEWLLKHEMKYR